MKTVILIRCFRKHRNDSLLAVEALRATLLEARLSAGKLRKPAKLQQLPATDLTSDEDSDPDQMFSQTQKQQSSSRPHRPRRKAVLPNYSSGDESEVEILQSEMEIPHKSDDDNESDLEVPYAHNFDGTQARLASKLDDKPKEPLRPGDVIFYNNPVFVAGAPAARRVSQILQTNPDNHSCPLELDNAECLPADTQVRRVREYRRGHLYHHEGLMRPIEMFVMTKASLNKTEKENLPGLRRQVERCRKILAEGRAAVEKDPSDENSSDSDDNSSTKNADIKEEQCSIAVQEIGR